MRIFKGMENFCSGETERAGEETDPKSKSAPRKLERDTGKGHAVIGKGE